jgi:protein-S-isoprenylcysteine O-methyltransferase Ste14
LTVDPVSQSDNEIPPSLGDLVRQLMADALAWFDAERQVYGVQARLTRRAAGWIAGFAFAAIVIAQGAMIAFVVGILLTLAPVVGPGWATVIIVIVCSILAGLCVWQIRVRLRAVRSSWRRRHDG